MTKKPKRAAILDSPASGQGTDGPKLARWFTDRLRAKFPHVPVFDAYKKGELEWFTRMVVDYELELAIFMGGDGSVHIWLSKILPELIAKGKPIPQILIVPRGTLNNIARDVGVRGPDPHRTLQGIVDKLSQNAELNVCRRHVLQINDQFGFIYGTGAVANFLDRYYEGRKEGERLGVRRAFQVTVGVLKEEALAKLTRRRKRKAFAAPFRATVRLRNGEEVQLHNDNEFIAFMVSTLTNVGMGCKPTYRALEKYERFHAIGVRDNFWRLVGNMPELFLGLPMKGNTLDEVVSEISIDYGDNPPTRIIDGEMYSPEDMPRTDVIRLGPRLEFIRS